MNRPRRTARGVAIAITLLAAAAAAAPAVAAVKKPAPAASKLAAAAPRVQVTVDSLLDRRTTSDFPHPSLSLTLALQGEDALAVKSARPRVTRAVDDTGRDLANPKDAIVSGRDGWQEARGEGAITPRIELASPARKAKTLTAVEGVVETYLPSRDAAATVRIDRVLSKQDKPLATPALAAQGIRLGVLSRAGLEREKKQAEERAKAKSAKGKPPKKEGLEGVAEAMADVLVTTIQRLFENVGENDLILKVDDPWKKIFSFDLAAPDGTAVQSYGTTEIEGYRILRMLEPIPPSASLQVRLKTPKSFSEVRFAFQDVKLP
ncbi:MAG: hypothetical protein M3167_03390 [Acidobacteriota bacterium]|nr:hypothetical protein [Acidobacteriota bacterium]